MSEKNDIKLTSAEIALLWDTYINDSMASCVFKHFLAKTKDSEVKSILELASTISKKHLEYIGELFSQEGYAIPDGFRDPDVTPDAPALFQDTFYLNYLKQMSKVGMNAYSLGISTTSRSDIRQFFNDALKESVKLDNLITETELKKGIYVRPPYIEGPKQVEYIKKTDFLDGPVGYHRPLLGMEVAHLYGCITSAALGETLCTAFSQVATSKDVMKFLLKLREKAAKHQDMMIDKMKDTHLKVPTAWNDNVTDSITPPFSDKLMLFHICGVMATALANYGVALAASLRLDLATTYRGIIRDLGTYIQDGIKLMIKNGWMEKPPQAINRNELAFDRSK